MKTYIKKVKDGDSRIKAMKQLDMVDKLGNYIFILGLIVSICCLREGLENNTSLVVGIIIMLLGLIVRYISYKLLEEVRNVLIYKNYVYVKDEDKHLNILNELNNSDELHTYFKDNFNQETIK